MKFIFEIEPVAQARPRATRCGKGIRFYDPKKTADFKKQLKQLAINQFKEKPFENDIFIEISFYRPIQKSLSRKEYLKRQKNKVRPTVKPDLDNYVKSTLDALNGVLWSDDNIITEMTVRKLYSDEPRIELTILERNA